jgi:hypothetical protein
MNHQAMFSEFVRRHFAYLIDEFGFSTVEDQYDEKSNSCIVAFQNKWRYVKLVWGLRDGQFYFAIYRVLKNGQPTPYGDGSSDHFYITNLASFFEPGLDIEYLAEMSYYQPSQQVLEDKIKTNAELLYKYGKAILEGKSWFDWQVNEMITDGSIGA